MRIKMIETTVFEGIKYEKEKEYEVEKETAKALGSSAKIIKEEKTKIIDESKNTMMTGKEVKKKAKK